MLPEISEVIFNIGAFYNNRMKKDSAIFYFEKVIQILQRAKSDNVKLRAYSVLANLYAEAPAPHAHGLARAATIRTNTASA